MLVMQVGRVVVLVLERDMGMHVAVLARHRSLVHVLVVPVVVHVGVLVRERRVSMPVRVALGRGRGDAPGDLAQKLKRAQTALSRIAKEMEEVDHLIAHSSSRPPRRDLPEFESLSSREWEVLRRLMNHKRPPAIARELFISPHTVRNHLKSIYAKLNVHSQTELLDRVLGPMD